MGTSYVVTGISGADLLKELPNIPEITMKFDEKDNSCLLTTPTDNKYAVRKAAGLAKTVGRILKKEIAPDDTIGGGEVASVWLFQTPKDPDNAWFEGWGVSVNHPELVLEKIVKYLKEKGHESDAYSEHSEIYWLIVDADNEGDEDETG
jgi:hypothetical protein